MTTSLWSSPAEVRRSRQAATQPPRREAERRKKRRHKKGVTPLQPFRVPVPVPVPVVAPSASGPRRPPFAPAADISLSSTRSHLTESPGRLRLCLAFPYLCCSRRLLPHQPHLFSPASCIRRSESRPPRHRVHSDCKGTRPGHPLETSAEAKKHSGLGRPKGNKVNPSVASGAALRTGIRRPHASSSSRQLPDPAFWSADRRNLAQGLGISEARFRVAWLPPTGPEALCVKS